VLRDLLGLLPPDLPEKSVEKMNYATLFFEIATVEGRTSMHAKN